ncbi:MAG: GNAT family N-acetyltransferase [Spirulina sp. DLM2.Bin59]|nr:MAG: GNAT family N-acetyltransferase [Spirulina sp. DLM2.Bin59]
MFWVQPFLRLGIYEDLRARFRANTPQYHCLTATLGTTGLIIGTVEIAVRPLHWGAYQVDYPYISNLAVHPDYRRRGVARQLLLGCEPKALEWGFAAIYLHVLDRNQPARKLYKSLGYHTEDSWPASGLTLWQPQRLLLYKTLMAKPC